jgi:DNA modification methylase
MKDYQKFLESKAPKVETIGFEPASFHPILFDWQKAVTGWAIKLGRAAIFADCGLGKSLMQIEWARQMYDHLMPVRDFQARVLIVAPLSVAQQTIEIARSMFNTEIRFLYAPTDDSGIFITNYQKLHKFVDWQIDAIVLDESSILKSLDGKTRNLLLDQFTDIPYRLCCTATPSPNDLTELGNHSEFLGVMSRREMLANYFVHDSGKGAVDGYRLKGHAKDKFWQWVAQWAVYIRKPSDIGYTDENYLLPELLIEEVVVESNYIPEGKLFPDLTGGIKGRTQARRHTLDDRVEKAAEIINGSKEQWVVWCGLNEEGTKLFKKLKGKNALVEGKTDDEDRIIYDREWRKGSLKTMVTKSAIFGFGMNWQHCHNMLLLGMGDSWEQYYQLIRRCYRFGQKHPVRVVIVTSDAEMTVVENVRRKETQARELAEGIIKAMKTSQIQEVSGMKKTKAKKENQTIETENYTLMLGDCVERVKEVADNSIGLSIFSPPFAKLYCYSDSDADMGNCRSYDEFFEHFKFLIPEIMRITMPGRLCAVHCQDLTTTKNTDGYIGRLEFSGDIRKAFVDAGWIFSSRVTIDKNPQAQAIRTKAKTLMFVQKNKDSSWSWPALADYIMVFQKPGENPEPVDTDVTNEEWIKLAHPIWYDIDESDTLNARIVRDEKDEAHLCPLQLGTISNAIRLWSNVGDRIFSPFTGIGSEGYKALQLDRKFVGIELKEQYFKQAAANLKSAIKQEGLFAVAD